MKRFENLLVTALSALAIAALPVSLDLASGGFEPTAAHAKGGNSGGYGGDKGGGGAGGNGKGGSDERGKSGEAKDRTKSSSKSQTASRSTGNVFRSFFRGERSRVKGETTISRGVKTKTAKATGKTTKVVALPPALPRPAPNPRTFMPSLPASIH